MRVSYKCIYCYCFVSMCRHNKMNQALISVTIYKVNIVIVSTYKSKLYTLGWRNNFFQTALSLHVNSIIWILELIKAHNTNVLVYISKLIFILLFCFKQTSASLICLWKTSMVSYIKWITIQKYFNYQLSVNI